MGLSRWVYRPAPRQELKTKIEVKSEEESESSSSEEEACGVVIQAF